MSNYNDQIKLIGKTLMSQNGEVFIERGKAGVKDANGKVLVPAEYDQIEKCSKYIYILRDGYLTLYSPRSIRSWNIENESRGYMYAEKGKLGWKDFYGYILIPAEYDEISRWGDDVFEVQTGSHWHYINCNKEEILTDFAPLGEDEEDDPPFDLYHPDNKILTVQEYVGHNIDSDPNVVNLDGVWVRLSRKTGREISEMLVNQEDEYPMREEDLMMFNNSFSYEYNVYLMHSYAERGVCDCLRQAYKMGAFDSSWYYLVKMWKASGEEPLAAELRAIRYSIGKSHQLGKMHFALGHDSSLGPGETKMLIVTHYNERCFPPSIEFKWADFLCEQSLENIKANIPELRRIVKETYLPEYINEVWWDMLHDRINDISYNSQRSWEETERVLDYFKKDDTAYLRGVHWAVECLMECDTSKVDPYFYINKLKWLIENGALVNFIKKGETGLDLLNKPPRTFLNDHPVSNDIISECKKMMIQYGALTMKELIKKESLNNDYLVELQRMRQ